MIEHYLNDDARAFLDSFPSDADRDWSWQVIDLLRQRFPQTDHWTTGGVAFKYTDLRFGRRQRDKKAAHYVMFWLRSNKAGPYLQLGRGAGRRAGAADMNITRQSHPTPDDIGAWLDTQGPAIAPELAMPPGHGYSPADYLVAAGEVEEVDGRVETTDGADLDPDPPPEDACVGAALNMILYGPPGTGKTYATVDEALSMLDPAFVDSCAVMPATTQAQVQARRRRLKTRFDELVSDGRIGFVTFHQSFSYEDFVEGLRAVTDDDRADSSGGLKYRVEPGVFQKLCTAARRDAAAELSLGVRDGARIWKLSIGRAGENQTRHYCYTHGEARVGWDQVGDLRTADLDAPEHGLGSNDRNSLNTLLSVAVGDVIVCIRSINSVGGIGVVTGEYRHDPTPPEGVSPDYVHVLPVRWLATDLDLDIRTINGGLSFTQKTLYPLDRFKWSELSDLMGETGLHVGVPASSSAQTQQPYVLIIDEINRGNVSRIFGELITLIEPSKRAGSAEALSVTLPYSKKAFSVPGNVFLLGTMNTADRSLAGLDIALRRRFTFKEMAPQPDLLRGVEVHGVDVGELLAVMNERIEVLLDRDHTLGHAYFMRLAEPGGNTLAALAQVFRGNVLPLLQEYFFEDWERIALVLNDLNKPEGFQFVRKPRSNLDTLFGADHARKLSDRRWLIDERAFEHIETYRRILA